MDDKMDDGRLFYTNEIYLVSCVSPAGSATRFFLSPSPPSPSSRNLHRNLLRQAPGGGQPPLCPDCSRAMMVSRLSYLGRARCGKARQDEVR